jgi:hypothetical protein
MVISECTVLLSQAIWISSIPRPQAKALNNLLVGFESKGKIDTYQLDMATTENSKSLECDLSAT